MGSSVQNLIRQSVPVEGYVNPVAYDPNFEGNWGYWICKQCASSFFAGGDALHEDYCPVGCF